MVYNRRFLIVLTSKPPLFESIEINREIEMSITTFRPRNLTLSTSSTPDNIGPGVYFPEATFSRYRAPIPFGSTTRRELFPEIDERNQVGPGSYEPHLQVRSRSANTNFALSSDRKYFEQKDDNPGPAEHSNLIVWGPTHRMSKSSFSGRIREDERSIIKNERSPVPGPGSYDPKVERSSKAALFSMSRAPQREPVYFNGMPGPANYTINRDGPKSKDKTPSAVFNSKTKRETFNTKDKADGYMLEHKAWPAVPISMGPFGGTAKRELNYGNHDTPVNVGPGAYNPKFTPDRPKMKRGDFGVDHDFLDSVTVTNPGPGYYFDSQQKNKIAMGLISKSERPDIFPPSEFPGPANYDPYETEDISRKSLMKIPNPAFKNKEVRDSLVNKQKIPGPAAYNIKINSKGPSNGHRFPKAPRFSKKNYVGSMNINDSPSPANYTIEPEGTKESVRGYSFNKSGRFSSSANNNPSPDSYNTSKPNPLLKQTFNVNFGYSPIYEIPQDDYE